MNESPPPHFDPFADVKRPSKSLFVYYFLSSLVLGPLFFVPLIPLYFKYHTMRYRLDDEGISMRWGVLFRREINLTYARIQDIHLVSNLVERWLGLARIQIQTASGSSRPEMTIEGVSRFETLRDFLYTRMRGSRGASEAASGEPAAGPSETARALREAAEELRAIRTLLDSRLPDPPRED